MLGLDSTLNVMFTICKSEMGQQRGHDHWEVSAEKTSCAKVSSIFLIANKSIPHNQKQKCTEVTVNTN